MIYGNWVREQDLVEEDDWNHGEHRESSRSFWTSKFEQRTMKMRSFENYNGELSDFKKNLRMSLKLWCDQMGRTIVRMREID